MISGVVKKVMKVEGFGFIKASDGIEHFFHRSSLTVGDWDQLREGVTRVAFEHEDGLKGKGPRAVNVQVI